MEILSIRQLDVHDQENKVIHSLQLTLNKGEIRFLSGPCDTGKSTLLQVIQGKIKPTTGHILYKDSFNLAEMQEHQITDLGIRKQSNKRTFFPNLTVFQNLLLALKHEHRILATLSSKIDNKKMEQIHPLLQAIGLTKKINHPSTSLTPAEKQRLELAIMFLKEPELLLLDKPSTGLTATEMDRLEHLLFHFSSKQIAMLIIENNIEFIRQFPIHCVSFMQDGMIFKEGKVADMESGMNIIEAC